MINILNRMAWIISVLVWFSIYIIWWFSILGSTFLSDFSPIATIIISTIIGIIIKNIIFSKYFIESNLDSIDQISTQTVKKEDTIIQEPIDISNNIEEEKTISQENQISQKNNNTENIPEESNIIKDFFTVNALAKIWWIFIFLWVVFFMSIFYIAMPPMWKLIMWILFWAIIFCIWVFMDKKWFYSQSRVLMWTWILINYLVILSWRYIIGGEWILSQWPTFILLILNTILSVATSLIYKSDILLLFSFVIAYLNPFLVWWSSTNPTTLLIYWATISTWALILSTRLEKNLSEQLFYIAFIGWNWLFVLAPFTNWIQWIFKLIFILILTTISIFLSNRKSYKDTTIILTIFWFIFGFLVQIIGNYVLKNWWSTITEINFSLEYIETISYIIYIFILLSYSYYLSLKKDLWKLYSISTLLSTLVLITVLQTYWDLFVPSIITVGIFWILNIGFILYKLDIAKINFANSMLWISTGAIFIGTYIYHFGYKYLDNLALWGLFLWIWIIYLICWVFIAKKSNISLTNFFESEVETKNLIYNFAAILIWYLVIAVAVIFAQNPEIIAIIWLIKANLILYIFRKWKDNKVYYAWLIILFIALGKLLMVSFSTSSHIAVDITCLISFISLNLNFKILEDHKEWNRIVHDIFYIIGVFITWVLIINLIPSWYSYLWFHIIVTTFYLFTLSFIYRSVYIWKITKEVYCWALIFLMWFNAYTFYDLYNYVNFWDIWFYTKMILYTTPIIIWLSVYNINRSINNFPKKYVNLVTYLYLFIITTLMVHINIKNMFIITIYWWIVAFGVLYFGIQYDKGSARTIGLYIISLTICKVLFFDIWNDIDNPLLRVVALMVVGGLMIAVSSMYTKKYWNSIKSEFDIKKIMKN